MSYISGFGVEHVSKGLSRGQVNGLTRAAHRDPNSLRRLYARRRLDAKTEGDWAGMSSNHYRGIHQGKGMDAKVDSKAAEMMMNGRKG